MRPLARAVARIAPAARQRGLRVLLYHAVDYPVAEDGLGLRVAPDEFRAHMEMLRAEGYRVVPLRAVVEDGESLKDAVAITFDDGYRSQLAAAVLEEFGYPATFFVVVRFLDGAYVPERYWERWGHLTWPQVEGLARRGFEIGAHSWSHPRLTRCDAVTLRQEVAGAKARLEARLGRPVVSFSYPHGAYNAAVMEAVRAAGYRLACTSFYGDNGPGQPPFELRRLEVSGRDRLADVRRKLRGQYDWLRRWQGWRIPRA